MEVDDALMKLGKFNRWRIATYCMVCCSVTVTGCWHMMVVVFVGELLLLLLLLSCGVVV